MAKKTGPPPRMGNDHRDKIKNSNILSSLIEHVEGTKELTGSQVQAGLGLLKKVLPDTQSIILKGDAEEPITHEFKWQSEK